MSKIRIIARLDIKGPNVIKGIRFDGLRIMGRPDELAMRYYEQGADELLYIDTVASLYGRDNIAQVVREAAGHIFIPMTVGGGIRSVEDARALLQSGADKVAVNTAAVKRPELITEIAEALGSQAVVASLQVKKKGPESWEIYIDNGRETTGIDAIGWAKRAASLGAGEILVTSVDRDGTAMGFETELVKAVVQAVNIPVIAGGGAKTPEDISDLVLETGVDAVTVASMIHYKRYRVGDIKNVLKAKGVPVVEH
ncbi:MAG: imidazole glycerol phosphate synthase subunit HisF [Candidatus Omnitrophica bacterium]|nr:imidazole glycerol phosphate synthase subunit HisF [Candidatus Omnitrophota bacterium]